VSDSAQIWFLKSPMSLRSWSGLCLFLCLFLDLLSWCMLVLEMVRVMAVPPRLGVWVAFF
jgi:hypothetical protein